MGADVGKAVKGFKDGVKGIEGTANVNTDAEGPRHDGSPTGR
jgi:Sec-independent protein translocase protein TatA